MVIIPIICALLLNLFHKKDRTVKLLAIFVAVVIPAIPLLANYGVYFFGGHAPLISDPTLLSTLPANLQNSTIALFHPAVTILMNISKNILFILGIVAFFAIFTS